MATKTTLFAVALTVPVLAGCLAGPTRPQGTVEDDPRLSLEEIEERLTDPVHDEIERTEHRIQGHGDTEIWLDLYRPADAEEGIPAILLVTPYQYYSDARAPYDQARGDCETGRPESCPYDPWLVEHFVPRGYAVAFADVRGSHNSGGCIEMTGPKQWEDGARVVEWLGTRDWSNGRVGMYGISYEGGVQVGTALLDPPHLTTIVPSASISNLYGYFHYDGVPYTLQGPYTMSAYTVQGAIPGTDPGGIEDYPDRFACDLENHRAGMDRSGDWNDYWERHDFRPHISDVRASVLQVHGLQDWNVKPDHLDPMFEAYPSEKRLVLGQWGHVYPDADCGEDPTFCRQDWERIVHRWYDHWLHGIETGILDDLPPVLIQDDTGDWRGIDAFPPEDPETVTYHPAPDGSLSPEAPDAAEVVLRDWPREVSLGPLRTGIDEAAAAAGRPPVAVVFETEALEEDLHYTGRPRLELAFSTDAESTHWVVHLVEVDPAGDARTIDRGYLDTRHRRGVDDPRPLTPGERVNVTIRMYPQDDVVEAGNRLRLLVTNDDGWVHQDDTYATSRLQLGDATRLVLPVNATGPSVPGDALRPGLSD